MPNEQNYNLQHITGNYYTDNYGRRITSSIMSEASTALKIFIDYFKNPY